jgi:GMP synthase-like glutamine amidotransferase
MTDLNSLKANKRRRGRFAILDCEDEVELSYIAIAFSRLFSFDGKENTITTSSSEEKKDIGDINERNEEEEEEEEWEHHRVPEGELPDLREIKEYRGIIITGSRHSCIESKTMRWMKQLKQFLQRVVNDEEVPVKILAINFGAHVVCEALGGKVQRRSRYETVGKFRAFVDCENCERALPERCWMKTKEIVGLDVLEKRKMVLFSRQRDEISELPNGAVMLTKVVGRNDGDSSSDDDVIASVFEPVEHDEFSKFIPEKQKPKLLKENIATTTTTKEKKKKNRNDISSELPSNESVCSWVWSPPSSQTKDKLNTDARVLAWQHTLLRDPTEKTTNTSDDPAIVFLSIARSFLRSKDSSSSYLNDTKESLAKCLEAGREAIEARSLNQWKKKSIVRDDDDNTNTNKYDENDVVVLDRMEHVAEQAFTATAKAVKSELLFASEEFRLYSELNDVAKHAFEKCQKDVLDLTAFAEKIYETEKSIYKSISPTIERIEKQLEMFEQIVLKAEGKCDDMDKRLANL